MLWSTMMKRKKLSLMVIVLVVVIQQLQLLFLVRWLFFSTSINVVSGFSVSAPASTVVRRTQQLYYYQQSLSNSTQLFSQSQRTDPSNHRVVIRSFLSSFPRRILPRKSQRNGHHDGDDYASPRPHNTNVKNQTKSRVSVTDHDQDDNDDNHNRIVDVVATAEKAERLQYENTLLRDVVRRLELENERLKDLPNRIVIETFEGEGKLLKQQKRRLEEIRKSNYDQYPSLEELHVFDDDVDDDDDDHQTTSLERRPRSASAKDSPQLTFAATVETPSDETEMALWCDQLDDDTCPVEPTLSFGEALRDRAYWLVGLLVLQSLSGLILSRHESLLAQHPFIIYFLTMLVGAGGNAGNQASVRVIRGLALGTLNEKTQGQFLMREIKMATALSGILSLAGFIRAIAFRTPLAETLAVTAALAMIVFTSVGLGAVLPILLQRVGVDPAHSSTTIQVIMDILGVILTVAVSSAILDSPVGQYLISAFAGAS